MFQRFFRRFEQNAGRVERWDIYLACGITTLFYSTTAEYLCLLSTPYCGIHCVAGGANYTGVCNGAAADITVPVTSTAGSVTISALGYVAYNMPIKCADSYNVVKLWIDDGTNKPLLQGVYPDKSQREYRSHR